MLSVLLLAKYSVRRLELQCVVSTVQSELDDYYYYYLLFGVVGLWVDG